MNRQRHLQYRKWRMEGEYRLMNEAIVAAYQHPRSANPFFTKVRFFTGEAANGLSLVFRKTKNTTESVHYCEYLKARFLELGFGLQHSYREINEQGLHVEVTDKYFFQSSKGGSLELEYVCVDNVPSHCKVKVIDSHEKKNNPESAFQQFLGTVFKF